MNRRIFFVLGALPTLACSVVIGESFSGYTVAPMDASAEAGSDAMNDGPGDSATGDCTTTCTGANMICDPADKKCKLDGTTSNVGGACVMTDPTCGTAANHECNDEGSHAFPGGYCTVTMCTLNALCPIGATCAHLSGGDNACYKICSSSSDCRSPDYECLNIDPLYTSGGSHKICFPTYMGCYTAIDCPAVKPTCMPDGLDAGRGFCK